MFEAGIKARYMMNGRVLSLFFASIVPRCLRLAAVMLICAAAAAASGNYSFFLGEKLSFSAAFIALCLSGSVFLLVFSYFREMYFNSRLCCLSDSACFAPESFFGVKRLILFFRYRFLVFGKKLLWAVVYFTPSGCVLFVIYFLFSVNGFILRYSFYGLSLAFAVLFLLGAVFYGISTGRYFLCDYLFSSNPLQPSAEIVRESVRLTEKSLTEIFIKRIRLLPGRLLPFFPFLRVYSFCTAAALCGQYFADSRYYKELNGALDMKRAGPPFCGGEALL